jgi:hypothetical protein
LPHPTGGIAWRQFDGTPNSLPPEDVPVLVYAAGAGDTPAIRTLARDERQSPAWRNPDFQDIRGDVQVDVEIDDCWGFLPEDPRLIDRRGIPV